MQQTAQYHEESWLGQGILDHILGLRQPGLFLQVLDLHPQTSAVGCLCWQIAVAHAGNTAVVVVVVAATTNGAILDGHARR